MFKVNFHQQIQINHGNLEDTVMSQTVVKEETHPEIISNHQRKEI